MEVKYLNKIKKLGRLKSLIKYPALLLTLRMGQ